LVSNTYVKQTSHQSAITRKVFSKKTCTRKIPKRVESAITMRSKRRGENHLIYIPS
jgi:hypothetical protein